VKRLLYLVTAVLVAMLILVPTAMAQTDTTTSIMQEQAKMREKDLPKSGGMPVGSILLPAAALLVGGGIIGYAVLRRR
jgi:curli biogenesis system outer membrane secretion channel CsgG